MLFILFQGAVKKSLRRSLLYSLECSASLVLKYGCFSAEEKLFTFPPLFIPKLIPTQFWLKFVLTDEKFTEQGFKWDSLMVWGKCRMPSHLHQESPHGLCSSQEKAASVTATCGQLCSHRETTQPTPHCILGPHVP